MGDRADDRAVLWIEAGPDAGRRIDLPAVPVVLGRAVGAGRIDDPSMEVHHLLVERVGPTGSVAVTQLAGRAPVRVEGIALCGSGRLRIGDRVEVGSTRMVVAPPHAVPDGGDAVVLGVASCSPSPLRCRPDDRSPPGLVGIDPHVVRRLLVSGPSGSGLVRSVVAQLARFGFDATVTRSVESLGECPPTGRAVIVHDPCPLVRSVTTDRGAGLHRGAGWPSADGLLPADAAIVDVGVTWRAVLLRPRTAAGAHDLVRFHAAGRAPSALLR